MNDSKKAKVCLQRIVDLFKEGDIPKALAVATIPPQAGIPSAKWSLSNRLLQFLADTSDARGFRQWQETDRKVKKGADAYALVRVAEGEADRAEKVAGARGLTEKYTKEAEGLRARAEALEKRGEVVVREALVQKLATVTFTLILKWRHDCAVQVTINKAVKRVTFLIQRLFEPVQPNQQVMVNDVTSSTLNSA